MESSDQHGRVVCTDAELNQLSDLLDVLRRRGVTSFKGLGVELVLGPESEVPVKKLVSDALAATMRPTPAEAPAAPSLYKHPALGLGSMKDFE